MVDKKVWPMIMMHAPLKPGTSEGTETCGECISVVLFLIGVTLLLLIFYIGKLQHIVETETSMNKVKASKMKMFDDIPLF